MLLDEVPIDQAIVPTEAGYDLLPGKCRPDCRGIEADGRPGARAPAERAPGQARRPLPHHPDRLPADPAPAHHQRPDRSARRADPGAVRILRPGGPGEPARHHRSGARRLNPQLEIEGLLRTMYDVRNNPPTKSRAAQQTFRRQELRSVIPRNIRLAEAPATASRSTCTTASRAAPSPTSALARGDAAANAAARRQSTRTETRMATAKKRGLGRGLTPCSAASTAMPTARLPPPRRRSCSTCRWAPSSRAGTSRARPWIRRKLEGAGRLDPRPGRDRAGGGARGGCRPPYELIAGERRWRATQLAGWRDSALVRGSTTAPWSPLP